MINGKEVPLFGAHTAIIISQAYLRISFSQVQIFYGPDIDIQITTALLYAVSASYSTASKHTQKQYPGPSLRTDIEMLESMLYGEYKNH